MMAPPRRRLWVTPLLVAINLIIYIAMEVWGGSNDPFVLTLFGAKERSLVFTDGEVWRLLSATFLHADIIHLLMNGFAIFYLGQTCESLYGPHRFAVLYIASAIGGSIVSAVATPHLGVGASGATFGLIGAMLVFAVRARDMMPDRSRRALFWFFLPWLALSMWLGFAAPLIDGWAHLGGALSGIALAVLYVRGRTAESLLRLAHDDARHIWTARVAWLAVAAAAGFTIHSVVQGESPALKEPLVAKRFEIEGFEVAIPKSWTSARGQTLVALDPVFRDPRGLFVHLASVATNRSLEATLDLLTHGGAARDSKQSDLATHEFPAREGVAEKGIGRSILRPLKEGMLLTSIALIPLRDRVVRVMVSGSDVSRRYHLQVLQRLVEAVKATDPPATDDERATRWVKLVRSRMELARIVAEEDVLRSEEMSDALDLLESAYLQMGRSKHLEALLAELYKTLVTAWEKDLSTTKDPTADRLNRLAWIYATALIDAYRNPARAVELATRAVERSNWRLAPIIDTLAEAYHARGDREKALATIARAIEKEPGHRYYTEQKTRFEKGLQLPPAPPR